MSAPLPSHRAPAHDVDPLFPSRWSPRAFTGEAIPHPTLLGLFEAAHWAPSSANTQPWRFVYARRDTPPFERLLATLAPANQAWAHRASALIALVSARFGRNREGDLVPLQSHAFDTGAAWAQLALQAHLWGWSTHAMGGFDRDRAREVLAVPADHEIQAVVAVGRQGDPSSLPEWAKAREVPNDRKPVEELVREGTFSFPGER